MGGEIRDQEGNVYDEKGSKGSMIKDVCMLNWSVVSDSVQPYGL